ncbi:DNA-binding transcriptional regulator [Nocardia sp. BMG51109]|uniref:helix-turn-helix domain-containing protein n=1 Tax=Nocardia sp. BMG51109 TaxID=1056816 RepID=UPI0004B26ECA|nr:helix-turn-helix transcriptional regulator [Nocardia sp. BMG51109]
MKALRMALRMSQADFARMLGCGQRTVSGWERGQSGINKTAQLALDEVCATLDPVVRARFEVLVEEDDVDRREFLKTAALAAATAGSATPTVTPASIGHLRQTVHTLKLLDDSLGSDAAKPLIDAAARTCTSLLPYCPELLKPDLSRLTAESVASSAWAAWDQKETRLADRLYKQAYEHALEAGDTDVQAGILVDRTCLAVGTHRYSDAADYAEGALAIRVRDPRMADLLALHAAEAYAHANRRQDARKQLETVSRKYTDRTTPAQSYAYMMAEWVSIYLNGSVLEATGDRRGAAEAVEESLPLIPSDAVRDQASTLLRLARLTAPQDLDRATDAAKQAVQLARKNTSPRLRENYRKTRDLLSPWDGSCALRDLDAVADEVLFIR